MNSDHKAQRQPMLVLTEHSTGNPIFSYERYHLRLDGVTAPVYKTSLESDHMHARDRGLVVTNITVDTGFKEWSAISGSLPGRPGPYFGWSASLVSSCHVPKNPRFLMCSRLYALGFCHPATLSPRNFDQ